MFVGFKQGRKRMGNTRKLKFVNDFPGISGHEDCDQYFSQVASYLSPQAFDDPQDVVNLLDSTYRPDSLADLQRKQSKKIRVRTQAYKLDTVARWQDWVAVLGVPRNSMCKLTRNVV